MTEPDNTDKRPATKLLWACWLSPVAAWALQLFFSYSFVEWYCKNPATMSASSVKIALFAVTFLCFLIAVSFVFVAYRLSKNLRQFQQESASMRSLFMVRGGVLISAFLAVTIVFQGWPGMVLPVCAAGSGS